MFYKQLVKCICAFSFLLFMKLPTSIAKDYSLVPDTLHLTIRQAEQKFIDSNLQLLAAYYNVQSQQALVEQARKWDNPVLNTDQNIYANKKFFRHGTDKLGNPDGEIFIQLQQLIKTAGKRNKQLEMARTGVELGEWQFKNVMNTLRITLRKDMYTLAQLQGNETLYDENLKKLSLLETAMQSELSSGNIARKEYLRVQALIISLKQDVAENERTLADVETEVKSILQLSGNVYVIPQIEQGSHVDMPVLSIYQLIDSAKLYNANYNHELVMLQYNQQNLKLQRALAVPDVTMGTEYDRAASYAPNYFGLTLSLPIPLLDRNKGNIKAAAFQVKQEETQLKQAEQNLNNEVLNAYQKLLIAVKLSSSANGAFYNDYEKLFGNIVESYNNRQISMIEFLSFFTDYKQIKKSQLKQILDLKHAQEDLNDVVGKDVAE